MNRLTASSEQSTDKGPVSVEQLSFEKHNKLLFTELRHYLFAKNITFIPIYTPEIIPLSRHCPIIFPGPKWPSPRVPFALFALSNNQENRFINEAGEWLLDYIPIQLRAYPFALKNVNGQKDTLVVDIKAPNFSSPRGTPLFIDEKTPCEELNKRTKLLKAAQQEEKSSVLFVQLLEEANLLVTKSIIGQQENDDNKYFSGFYIVDRNKFNALDDKHFLRLRECNALPLIEAHLNSLDRLGQLSTPNKQTHIPPAHKIAENTEGAKTDKLPPKQKQATKHKPTLLFSRLTSHLITALVTIGLTLWFSSLLTTTQPSVPQTEQLSTSKTNEKYKDKPVKTVVPIANKKEIRQKPIQPIISQTTKNPVNEPEFSKKEINKKTPPAPLSIELVLLEEINKPDITTPDEKTKIKLEKKTTPQEQEEQEEQANIVASTRDLEEEQQDPKLPVEIKSKKTIALKSPITDTFSDLLMAVKQDIKSNRLMRPIGNNATEKLRLILSKQPDHQQASQLLQQIIFKYVELAKADIQLVRLSSPPGNNAMEKIRAIQSLKPGNSEAKQLKILVAKRYAGLATFYMTKNLAKGKWMLEKALNIAPENQEIKQVKETFRKFSNQAK
ncbi:MAG: SapC family protein [Magnetococcales bacterium]|nr:SapC family protein [Magnetococcales bacterium]